MDYAKLRGAIREKYRTQEAFARAMGMHQTTLSSKLRDKTDWTRSEMEKACNLLGVSASIFFTDECARLHEP